MVTRSSTSVVACGALLSAAVLLGGCGPTRIMAHADIPQPLIEQQPVTVALHVPKEFSEHVHKESRKVTGKWEFALGKAQTETVGKLLDAMFLHVVPIDSVEGGAASNPEIRVILEPSIDEYSFVTPQDAGGPFFAVSIKYRMSIYAPDGKLADSWAFTGYGTAISKGVNSEEPLQRATALAIRDAGAKLATEFREQEVMKELLGKDPSAPVETPGPPKSDTPATPASTPATSSPEKPAGS
jgi:hypothetical protein